VLPSERIQTRALQQKMADMRSSLPFTCVGESCIYGPHATHLQTAMRLYYLDDHVGNARKLPQARGSSSVGGGHWSDSSSHPPRLEHHAAIQGTLYWLQGTLD
jgi:hypothetical protein